MIRAGFKLSIRINSAIIRYNYSTVSMCKCMCACSSSLKIQIRQRRDAFSSLRYYKTKRVNVEAPEPEPEPEPVPIEDVDANADVFGTLAGGEVQSLLNDDLTDEKDIEEEKYISSPPSYSQRLTANEYADLIKNHLKYRRLKDALDVLQVRMLKQDRMAPDRYIYDLLISGCAAVGYTKMAFKLYNDLKMRKLNDSLNIYTSLFNACANSPWPSDGLSRATALREKMKERGIEPNGTVFNSSIKAFGRCGDLVTAFRIVDEMTEKKIKVRVHTFNFLLQACISDKENGFGYALLTWRKMLQKREKPNIYSFNLMLRCAKECGVGAETVDLEKLLSAPPLKAIESKSQSDPDSSELSATANVLLPNMLSRNPSSNGLVAINMPKNAEERFALIGGMEGFLREVNRYDVKPDIKMMTQLLGVLPNDAASEEALMSIMDNLKIKYDIDFFNYLIKKRCLRFDYDSAMDVKTLIRKADKAVKAKKYWKHKRYIKMDVMTYGALALCCNTREKAQELINEMAADRMRINAEIIGTLFRQAAFNNDLDYVIFVLDTLFNENIYINDLFLEHFNKFKNKCKQLAKNDDKAKVFLKDSQSFYQRLIKQKENQPEHPWEQFRENQPIPFQRNNTFEPRKRMYYKHRRRTSRYVLKM